MARGDPDGNWQAALNKYQADRDDLYAGRKPRGKREGVTIDEAANRFLAACNR